MNRDEDEVRDGSESAWKQSQCGKRAFIRPFANLLVVGSLLH